MTLRNDGVQIRAEVPSGLSGDVDPLRGRRLGPPGGRGRTTVSSTQETPQPMPSDRTAAAVPDDERLPGDHSSTGPTTLFGSLLGYADARRDRLVGTVDGIDGVVGDPDDEVEPRGLVLRPALLGFVAVLAEFALQARDARGLVLRRALDRHAQSMGRLLLAGCRLRRAVPLHAGLVGHGPP